MKFDHVALVSKSIKDSIRWYQENLHAEVLYEDDTWGFMNVGGAKIALVTKHQHPPHVCFKIDDDFIEKNLQGKVFKKHRDGTESCYVKDIDGNFIEYLKCPDQN